MPIKDKYAGGRQSRRAPGSTVHPLGCLFEDLGVTPLMPGRPVGVFWVLRVLAGRPLPVYPLGGVGLGHNGFGVRPTTRTMPPRPARGVITHGAHAC